MTEREPVRRQRALGRIKRIHMVGIGGIGMSSIAEVLLSRGYQVTGSDLHKNDVTERLEALGATIYERHSAEHVGEADVVVFSSAVRPLENPETVEAERRRIPLIRRSEMLGELMRMKFGIGIAGTHGKTTTTSMVGLVVQEGGFDPTIIVGGKVEFFDSNAVSGEGDIIVIEADEYDRTFLRLTPSVAVITSIEAEHLDIYRDLDDLKEAFVQFANSVPFFGAAIVCLDDPVVQEILGDLDRRVITYGLSRQADIRADNMQAEEGRMEFDVIRENELLFRVRLHGPGIHNVRNALAAVAVGLELDVPHLSIQKGLQKFTGVHRRFQTRGEAAGVIVVDDYAHHPAEIRATLQGASTGWPDRRVIAVFQPHLYSRTRDFKDDFARSFFNADALFLTDVYGARETPIPDVNGQIIAEMAVRLGHRNVHYVKDTKDISKALMAEVMEGDIVVFMGAGDIWKYSSQFFTDLKEKHEKADEST